MLPSPVGRSHPRKPDVTSQTNLALELHEGFFLGRFLLFLPMVVAILFARGFWF